MERKKASDFPREVLDLFNGYSHGTMNRREFLDRATKYAIGGFTAAAMLESLSPNFAWGQQVATDDARVRAEYLTYPSPQGSGTMRGYFARPAKAEGRLPGVLVIHENRGVNPHIEDVTRRLAVEGYVAFAPDALTPVGGYPGDEDKARALFSKLDPKKRAEDMIAAADFLKSHPGCTGRIATVGFCNGGGVVNLLAVRVADLAAAVPFYGTQPNAEDTAKITAPLLIHYAEHDDRVNVGWRPFEAALKANGVKYEMHLYPGTNHAFYNDTTPRYNEAAAKLAWSRTLAFFKEHLKGPEKHGG
jgi:carboxymethylenebutenolidase